MTNFFLFNSLGALLLLTFLAIFNVKNVNKKGNAWFGVFCFTVFLILVEEELIFLKVETKFFSEVFNLAAFTVAPIFYLSIIYFVSPNRKWKFKDNFHFSFSIFYLVLIIGNHFFSNTKKEINQNENSIGQIISILFLILFALQLISYAFLSYIKVITHQKNIKNFSSNIENIDLQWLKYIIISVAILSSFWAIEILSNTDNNGNHFIKIMVFVIVYTIAFFMLKQQEIYPFKTEDKDNIIALSDETATSDSSIEKKKLISDEKFNEIKEQLLAHMKNERPYLESELSLIKLSRSLNTTTHILSYVINSGFDESFYQFINKYRIEEAKKLITDPKMNHLSILGIGFEVGFNSKSVFNTVFKNNTGLTPTEFKKTTLK